MKYAAKPGILLNKVWLLGYFPQVMTITSWKTFILDMKVIGHDIGHLKNYFLGQT